MTIGVPEAKHEASDQASAEDLRVLTALEDCLGQQPGQAGSGSRSPLASGALSAFLTGLFVGIFVAYLGLLSAGSSIPSLAAPESGWEAGATIAAIFILITFAFTLLGWGLHVSGAEWADYLWARLRAEAAEIPPEEKMGKGNGANVEQWTTFLQARADSKTSWIQSLSALGGLVPASALIQTIPPLHATLFTAVAAGVVAGAIAGWAFWAIRGATLERERILLVMALVLGGFLREDRHVLIAYLKVRASGRVLRSTHLAPSSTKLLETAPR
jgi:hypothetical protein